MKKNLSRILKLGIFVDWAKQYDILKNVLVPNKVYKLT